MVPLAAAAQVDAVPVVTTQQSPQPTAAPVTQQQPALPVEVQLLGDVAGRAGEDDGGRAVNRAVAAD